MAASDPTITEWLSAFFSGAAVVVSLGAAGLAFLAFRRDRRHVRITRVTPALTGPEAGRLLIEFHNDGAWDEYITEVGLQSGILGRRRLCWPRVDQALARNAFGYESIPLEFVTEAFPRGLGWRSRAFVRTAANGTYRTHIDGGNLLTPSDRLVLKMQK